MRFTPLNRSLWLQAGEPFGEGEGNEGMLQFLQNRGGCPQQKVAAVKRVNALIFRSRGDNPLHTSSIPMQHSLDGAGKLMVTASVSTDTVVPFTC